MGKLMYCGACERKAVGVKSKTDWFQVIFWGVITLGIYWLYYFSWHTWKRENKCPICGTKMVDLKKAKKIEIKKEKEDNKSVLTLFAQPSVDDPKLNKKALKKGEIKKSWNGLFFTDVGSLILDTVDFSSVQLISEREDEEWDIVISSDDLKIVLSFYKYKGLLPGAKNSFIKLGFNGNVDKITSIRDSLLKTAGNKIFEMDSWGIFTEATGITKNEVESEWKKVIPKLSSISEGDSNMEDILDKVKKLADLKDQGILTQEEFETKKKELLSRI